jgi:hypothetical protein
VLARVRLKLKAQAMPKEAEVHQTSAARQASTLARQTRHFVSRVEHVVVESSQKSQAHDSYDDMLQHVCTMRAWLRTSEPLIC